MCLVHVSVRSVRCACNAMNTCELCQVPGCSNSLYIQLHSCVPMSPAVSPPFPLCLCPGVQHAAQTTHLQQPLVDLERVNQGPLVNWSCSSQICSCLLLCYRLSRGIILYTIGGQRSFCGKGSRARISNEFTIRTRSLSSRGKSEKESSTDKWRAD